MISPSDLEPVTSTPLPVFDGHNDLLLRLHRSGRPDPERGFLDGEPGGHLDLPRCRIGGFAGGFFAVYIPSPDDIEDIEDLMSRPSYDVPLPAPVPLREAQETALAMVSILLRIERESAGRFRICRTAGEIRACLKGGIMAAVLHLEGAEAIDPELRMLDVLHAAGLRSVGPVWSRPTIFGHGVPFRFPSDPDTGEGLTDLGRELVRRCNRLRVMIDLSHLNERGFWDVARLSDAPLVATHSNAHALCRHSRNLTDRQLAAIRESGGLVAVNFATSFIREDGRKDANTPLDGLVRHLDHLIEHLGPEGVALGSDFDGATVPAAIRDAAGLPRLVDAMRRRGYDDALLRGVCSENWIRVLERTWGA